MKATSTSAAGSVRRSLHTVLRRGWPVGLAVLIATLLAQPPGALAATASRPNILLILVDDLGYGELGCQGNDQIPTPHIDAIARQAVRCTSGYVTASYCSPSRAGLLTGRYQTRFGHEFNPVGPANLHENAGLPTRERTLADALRAAGYATGLVGKWHLGGLDKFHPLERGFDEFYGFLHEGHFYVPPPYRDVTSFLRRKEIPGPGPRWRDGDLVLSTHMGYDEPPYDRENPILRGRQPLVEPVYLTDALTREAVAFIERHRQRPFFLYLSYNAVHSPLQATHAWLDRFGQIPDIHRRVFAAMLANLDDSVGSVMQKLRECGLEQQTLVFFISDNGGPTRELTSSNRPLRGGKGDVYEGGIRVPFLVQWKGRLPAGKEFHHPVSSMDVFPTALAAAGVTTPGPQPLDGVDLRPYLAGEREGVPHETLYWRMGRNRALRHGDWKLVRQPPRRGPAIADNRFQLFHLATDLGEQRDQADRQPQRLEQLTRLWQELDAQMTEPVWRPGRR